jgi:hypothetical protein
MEADAGTRDVIFLDESGFAPTMPTGYTWSRTGQRAVVPREDTRNRRVNVLGARIVGTAPDLLWERTPGKIDAAMLLESACSRLAGLPGGAAALSLAADSAPVPVWRRSRPCTVVLDNASAHVARAFKGRPEQLAKIGGSCATSRPAAPSSTTSNASGARPRTRTIPTAPTRASKPSAPPWTRNCPATRPASRDQQ